MIYMSFFLKTFVKKPVVWLTFVVVLLVSFFAFSTTELRDDLPCAVYSEDGSDEAQSIVSYLEKNGFYVCSSHEELSEMIKKGKADAGLVINEGLMDKMESGSLSRCANFYISDRTQNESLYKLMSAVAIYQTFMPYKAAQAASTYGYDADAGDIISYRDEIESRVNPLEFEIVSLDGAALDTGDNFDLPIGVLSISIFAILGFLCTGLIRRTGRQVKIRFYSFKEFFFKCMVPQCAMMGLIVYAASAIGLLISAAFFSCPVLKLLISLFIYIFILIWLFALISVLPLSDHLLVSIIAIDAAVSLVLCPLYEVTSLLIGYIGPLRCISAPYLMFMFFNLF